MDRLGVLIGFQCPKGHVSRYLTSPQLLICVPCGKRYYGWGEDRYTEIRSQGDE